MASMESTGSPPSRGRVSDQLSPGQESGGLDNAAPTTSPYDDSPMMPPVTRRDFASFTRTASHLDDYKGKQSTTHARSAYNDRNIMTPVTRTTDYSTTELLTSAVYRPQGVFQHRNQGALPQITLEKPAHMENEHLQSMPLSNFEADISPSGSEAHSGDSETSSENNSNVGDRVTESKQPFPETAGLSSMDHAERQAQRDDQLAAGVTATSEKPSGHRESISTVSTCLTPVSSEDIGAEKADRRQSEDEQVAFLRQELDDAKKRIEHQALLIHQAEVIDRTTSDTNSAASQASPEPERSVQPAQTRQAWPNRDEPPVTPSNWGDFSAPNTSWNVQANTPWGFAGSPTYNQYAMPSYGQLSMPFQAAQQRNMSVPLSPNRNAHNRGTSHFPSFNTGGYGYYNNQNASRNAFYPRFNAFSNFPDAPAVGGMNFGGLGPTPDYQDPGLYQAYTPQPIGTPLSPTATEFHSDQVQDTPWNSRSPMEPGETFVTPVEPLNYRRLLDRSVTMNWKYIVDKIVHNNDQQASIFLQQKLKVATVGQKYSIIEAIVAQAYPLMVNRFGNFLVQRCFEHGTPEQVVGIANAIRGNTLSLSMDPFGCHVVQKAFDAVPEEYKAAMVRELLRRIPDTVVHRYACHVWQKLFELRWADSPPQIMKTVNHALRGMWHQVALGETGSLVVQNIFENCIEEDKRPCITEVLDKIDIVAHGQFGNWCIQHICEHGDPPDKTYAVEHILEYATEYSIDQYASKVVEKCLKLGDPKFLDRYLARICQGRPERPRIPLIDIASDQYGNYLIQWILLYADPHPRDIVATHVRKHMVSLRGSKFGSRVGMLVCNPAHTPSTALFQPQPAGSLNNNRFVSAPSNSRGHIGAPGASMHAFRNGPYR